MTELTMFTSGAIVTIDSAAFPISSSGIKPSARAISIRSAQISVATFPG